MARRDPFESLPAGKARSLPFPFVLEELAPLDPVTRPMFGSLGVYVGDRIAMILRDKGPGDVDSGVWLAFDPDHEAAVVSLLPRLSRIEVFRSRVAGWMKLSSRSAEFEDDVSLVCRLLLEGDERIGKVPNQKRPSGAKAASTRTTGTKTTSTKTTGTKTTSTKTAGAKTAGAKTAGAKAAGAKAAGARRAPARAKARA